ncbi:MAG: hypothetical protein LBO62_05310 [Endomicrobium sp.]|nr:hypothetical protein [Endomicrobium sp.]
MNPAVQKNIVPVIDILVNQYGVKNVFVEGGYGKVSTKWLSDIKDVNVKKDFLEDLLNGGTITASEYYEALHSKSDFIYGLEDEKTHNINMARLAGIIKLKAHYSGIFELMLNDLEFLQAKYFNARNKRFAKLLNRRKAGKISSGRYYKILFKYLKDNSPRAILPADLNDSPNIVLFLQAEKLQNRLAAASLSRDIEKIVAKVKEELPYSFMPKSGDLTAQEKLLAYLNGLPKDFKQKYFTRQTRDYIAFYTIYNSINPVALIKEERELINVIRTAIADNASEAEISFLSDFFLYFADYMNASISADDYEYLKNKFAKFEVLWSKYSYYNYLDYARPFFDLLNAYYGANDKRNEIFLKHLNIAGAAQNEKNTGLEKRETLEEILRRTKNILIVITGGYHSKGIGELLNQKKISHAVITPYVNGEIGETLKNYENQALRQAGFPAQSLALTLASQLPDAKKAELFFNWAQKNLADISYEENERELINKLNEAAGGHIIFSLDNGVIYADNGSQARAFADISKSPQGKIIISRRDKFDNLPAQSPSAAINSRRFLKDFYAAFNITSLNFGANAAGLNVYPILKHIAKIAAKNNLLYGDGLIFDIAGIQEPGETIDGVETRLIARMPEFLQRAINENQIKKEDFKEENTWIKFLWVSGLLNDFIPSSKRVNNSKRESVLKRIFLPLKALFISPFSELSQISAAAAAKIKGDETLYRNFIDAHGYEGAQKAQLEAGVQTIYDAYLKLSLKGANSFRIKTKIVALHFSYNFKNILTAFGHNALNVFSGKKLIRLAVMTLSSEFGRFAVRDKTRKTIEDNLDKIIEKFPDASIERDENSNITGISIASERYGELQIFVRAFFARSADGAQQEKPEQKTQESSDKPKIPIEVSSAQNVQTKPLKIHKSKISAETMRLIEEQFKGKYSFSEDANGLYIFEADPSIYDDFKKILYPKPQKAALSAARDVLTAPKQDPQAVLSKVNTYYENDSVRLSLAKAVRSIIFETKDAKAQEILARLSDESSGVKIGISRGEENRITITSTSKDAKFNIVVYALDSETAQAGTVLKNFDKERGVFEDLSAVKYSSQVPVSIAKALEELIAYGGALEDSILQKNYAPAQQYRQDLIEVDETFDCLAILARSLYQYNHGADKDGVWEKARAYFRERFKHLGEIRIEDRGASNVRYLNCDFIDVYLNGEQIFTIVFGTPIYDGDRIVYFQNVINVIDVFSNKEQRAIYSAQGKDHDVLYLSDLTGARKSDVVTGSFLKGDNPYAALLNELISYSQNLEKSLGIVSVLKGYNPQESNLIRYQAPNTRLSLQDLNDLNALSVKRKSLDGIETFYFKVEDKEAADALIARIELQREEKIKSEAISYSDETNKAALNAAVRQFYIDNVNGSENPLIEELKKDYGFSAVSAGFYRDAKYAGKIRISADGGFIDIDEGSVVFYAKKAADPEDVLFGPLFAMPVSYSSEITNASLSEIAAKMLAYGKTLDVQSIEQKIAELPAVKQTQAQATDYTSAQNVSALKKAATQVFLEYVSLKTDFEEHIKEFSQKFGVEISYLPYNYNYSGFDLRERGVDEPYINERTGRYALSLKIPSQEFGDLYLFIAEGKIWLDKRNGYWHFRAARFSESEEDILNSYAALHPDENIVSSNDIASPELNALINSLLNSIISYGLKQDEQEQEKEFSGIDLYEIVSDGKKNLTYTEIFRANFTPNMQSQMEMGAGYLPTDNALQLAKAVKDIIKSGGDVYDIKERLRGLLEKSPYRLKAPRALGKHKSSELDGYLERTPYTVEIGSDKNSVFIKIKDPNGKNGERGVIIYEDGSVLEIKDDWYAQENAGRRYVPVLNTRYLAGSKNPGTDYSYLYETENLIRLNGKYYSTKRNQITAFLSKNNWVYENLTLDNIKEYVQAMSAFVGADDQPLTDYEAARVFEKLRYLGFFGGYLRVDGRVDALSIAHGDNTLCLSIQKARTKPNGVPQIINREFLANNAKNRDFTNFEEDVDVEYLRRTKLVTFYPSFRPETNYAAISGEDPDLKYYSGVLFANFIRELIDYGASLTQEQEPAEQESPSSYSLQDEYSKVLSNIIDGVISFADAAIKPFSQAEYSLDVSYEYVTNALDYVNSLPASKEEKLKDGAQITVFVINGRLPENFEKYDFKNTGLSCDGKIIWVSKKTGRYVLYSEAQDAGKIVITANYSFANVIGVNAKVSASSLIIDSSFEEERTGYDAFGNLTVARKYAEELSEFSDSSLPDVIAKIRKEEKAQKRALARNIIMDFGGVSSPLELINAAAAFNNSGTAQIALPLSLFKDKTQTQIAGILSSLPKGINVFASELETESALFSDKELISMGFSGHIYRRSDKIYSVDFLLGTPANVSEVSGFKSADELEKKLEISDIDSIKLIDVKEYISLLKDNDIEAKIKDALNFFNSEKLARLFYKKMSKNLAAQTAYEFDLSEIPSLTAQDFDKIIEAFSKPERIEILKTILKINSNASLKTALDKIERTAEQKDKDACLFAFLKAVAQKSKAKYDIPEGLADAKLYDLFVRTALSEGDVDKDYIKNFAQNIKIETGKEIVTAQELYEALKIKAGVLALENGSPAAAAAAYSLIVEYGERKTSANIQEDSVQIDASAVRALLSAA